MTPPDGQAGDDAEFYTGLQEIAEGGFPKHCAFCGRNFASAEDYIRQTLQVGMGGSGLKQTHDDDGNVVVELFRNCVCGSTLLGYFGDRRDRSEAGLRRRARFDELVHSLVARGLAPGRARAELLKILRGEPSTLLRRVPKQAAGKG